MQQRHRTVDEAYHQGREEGFDRGYDEGFAAARTEAKDARLPKLPKVATLSTDAPRGAPVETALTERRALELGALGLLAYGALRLLRTWPGRLVAAGSVVAFSGVISLALAVLAVVVCAVALAWAAMTAERAVRDTRQGWANLRVVARAVRRHL